MRVDAPPLEAVIELFQQAPHSAPALTLYALVSTLELPQSGCLFKLDKLQDLDPAQRQLAYQLMEMMVAGENQTEQWKTAKRRMDTLIRAG